MQASLSVTVVEPRQGITVLAGKPMAVRVEARDLGGTRLAGVGYVVRRFAGGLATTLDSATIDLAQISDTTQTFSFTVPASLVTNTQLDIYGIAFGPGSQSRVSAPRSVIVARCQTGQAGC